MKPKNTISAQLRAAIRASGMSRYRISKLTGIDQAVLCRFLQGQVGISLDSIDALGACLGLRIVAEGKKAEKKKGA